MKLSHSILLLAGLFLSVAGASAQVNFYANAAAAAGENWNTASTTKWTTNGTTFQGPEETPGNVYHTNGYTVRAGRIGAATGGAVPAVDAPSSIFLGEKIIVDTFNASSGLAGTGNGSGILFFELASPATGPRLGAPGAVTQASYTANIATGTSTVAGTQHIRFGTGMTTLNGTLELNGYTNFSIPGSTNDVLVTIKSPVTGTGSIDISGGGAGGSVANGWVTWVFEDLSGWRGEAINVSQKHTIKFVRDIDFRATSPNAALAFGASSVGFLNLSANVKFTSGKVSWGTNILPDGTYTAADLNDIWKTGGYTTLPFASGSGTLTVAPPITLPVITGQPFDETVAQGGVVGLAVAVTGDGPMVYEWEKDGVAIADSNSPILTISDAQMSAAGQYRVKITNPAGSIFSASATLTVVPPGPVTITTQPVSQTVNIGANVAFSVTVSGEAPFTFEWQLNGEVIPDSNTATLVLPDVQPRDAGQYRLKVSNALGNVMSNPVTLTVNVAPNPVTSGFAAEATGGLGALEVVVTNAADLKTHAEGSAPAVITVSGQISLASVGGSIRISSNKTIQGLDNNATIIGCLDLGRGGVSNVIIRGLNITNPGSTVSGSGYSDGGDGIRVKDATKVHITQCTLFNCADELIEISGSADNVTVAWCEFYYTADQAQHRYAVTIGEPGVAYQPLRVTLYGNWWSSLSDQRMPLATYGYVHMFNNYFHALGNTSGSVASDRAEFLAERNVYEGMAAPLTKQKVSAILDGGRIRSIGNTFDGSTGAAPDAGADIVFTPPYSYEMMPASQVAAKVISQAGNIGGAWTVSPVSTATATINAPATRLIIGDAFTLSVAPPGFTPTSYQWRLNNIEITGATTGTYSVPNGLAPNAGVYTVALGRAGGELVVSKPATIVLNSAVPPSDGATTGLAPEVQVGRGGGGGSPSLWFLGLLASLSGLRLVQRRKYGQ